MGVVLYLLLMGLTILLGYFVFRIQVRKDYERSNELSTVSTTLEFLIFAVHANLAYTFLASKWPAMPTLPQNTIQLYAGLSLTGIGLIMTLLAMSGLGFRKAFGQKQTSLYRSGFYRYTRNPQIVAYGILILGGVIEWPSAYAFGWFFVYGVIAHMMVITEEEHLTRVFGEDYEVYCREIPRYFGIW